jgi:multiple sugar transport system permease protein
MGASAPARRKPHLTILGRMSERRRFGLLLLAPEVLLLGALIAYPLIYLVTLSVQHVSLVNVLQSQHAFVGLDNFAAIISDSNFLSTIRTTSVFAAACLVLQLSVGLVLGLIFSIEFRAKKPILLLLLLPMLMTPVVIGLFWKLILNGEWGVANYLLSFVGVTSQTWLVDPQLALPAVIMVYSWGGVSFVALVVLGAASVQPVDLYEAARVDGATTMQTLRYITLPLLRPILLVISMILTIDAIKTFDIMYVLTGGGPGGLTRVFALEIYDRAFNRTQFSQAAAESLLLVAVTLVLVSGLVVALRRSTAD